MLRRAHGRAAELGRLAVVETSPADELPEGVPAPARPPEARDGAGRFTPGPGTSEIARRGARARQESRQLARLLGLWVPPDDHAYTHYRRLGEEWRDSYMATVAATIAGGEADEATTLIISNAALQTGASRYLFDEGAKTGNTGMLLAASRLADAARQSILTAFELATRTAQARPRNALAELDKRLGLLPLSKSQGAAEAPHEPATSGNGTSEEQEP